jgi:hypothetical protein
MNLSRHGKRGMIIIPSGSEVGEGECGHDMTESPPLPVYLLRSDIENYFALAISSKLRLLNRLGWAGQEWRSYQAILAIGVTVRRATVAKQIPSILGD